MKEEIKKLFKIIKNKSQMIRKKKLKNYLKL